MHQTNGPSTCPHACHRCELCVEEGCCKLADHRGWTALHSAAQYGHSEVVAELIKVTSSAHVDVGQTAALTSPAAWVSVCEVEYAGVASAAIKLHTYSTGMKGVSMMI